MEKGQWSCALVTYHQRDDIRAPTEEEECDTQPTVSNHLLILLHCVSHATASMLCFTWFLIIEYTDVDQFLEPIHRQIATNSVYASCLRCVIECSEWYQTVSVWFICSAKCLATDYNFHFSFRCHIAVNKFCLLHTHTASFVILFHWNNFSFSAT